MPLFIVNLSMIEALTFMYLLHSFERVWSQQNRLRIRPLLSFGSCQTPCRYLDVPGVALQDKLPLADIRPVFGLGH